MFRAPLTAEQQALVVVASGGMRYAAPDIATVDRHLAGLAEKIRRARAGGCPELARITLADADALLDRRAYLTAIA